MQYYLEITEPGVDKLLADADSSLFLCCTSPNYEFCNDLPVELKHIPLAVISTTLPTYVPIGNIISRCMVISEHQFSRRNGRAVFVILEEMIV